MHRRTALVLALALLASACGRDAAPDGTAHAAHAVTPSRANVAKLTDGQRLARILDVDNIGRRLDIFERIAGEPDDATATTSTYTVAGCTIDVETADRAIVWINVELTGSACTVDLTPVLRHRRVVRPGEPLTYGELERLVGDRAEYKVLCLGSTCGDNGQPDFEAVFPGGASSNYIAVAGASDPLSAGAQRQVKEWVHALTAANGDFRVLTELRCTRAYDPLARKALASAVVQKIGFGENEDADCDPDDEEEDVDPSVESAGVIRT
ncbi:hypothetical protein DWG18_07350 [Lysobacter sp. TY2-98]|uniref:hypothetical protein n=1 Tax=Lysobacter sp. TY2-98 TaxID=2290922 RepID=UPI000E2093D8|nr:hypothetical protein [Lysobacter sp. TY2-98]AXK72114.1 hypothetical protein DWG18_07350 [Lysobacter sp. TY2-98]